jgi:16S rRNA (adenine1518-N6/adenine1519-N6)-dimethyltransferase
VRSSIIAAAKVPVRETLDRYGITPRKRFGQNFLHDPAVARRIVAASGAGAGSRVLEIGPGLGALTGPLLEAGARVTAVEVDPRIAAYLEDAYAGRRGFTLVRGDVLRAPWSELAGPGALLVANLPYSITGPVLARLIDHADLFARATLMVQREVAQRLVAGAGGKEIGAPAVLLRLLHRVERLFDVGKGAFQPVPEVASSVIALERREGAVLAPGLRDAVNLAYRNRRKMLRKTLAGTVAAEGAIAAALRGLGRPPAARPEDLEPAEWPLLLERAREADA